LLTLATISWSQQIYAQVVFATSGNLHTARGGHTSTLLQDGTVLVAGGITTGSITTATAELYDTPSGTFSTTGNMTMPRLGHTATLLNNGQVLFVGGGAPGNNNTAELYNPTTKQFVATGNLNVPRFGGHTATLLNNGQVLIAGGADVNGAYGQTGTAELYNPSTGLFTMTGSICGGNVVARRVNHSATLLSTGQVLVAGGEYSYKEGTVWLGFRQQPPACTALPLEPLARLEP
jgi:N-acetylneuraminic acid mutarotase